jgi:hypothetical protein
MVLVRLEVFPVVDYARYVTARTYGVVVSQYRCFTLNPFPMDAVPGDRPQFVVGRLKDHGRL